MHTKKTNKKPVSIRIDEKIYELIAIDAKNQIRSFNNMIEQILVRYYEAKNQTK